MVSPTIKSSATTHGDGWNCTITYFDTKGTLKMAKKKEKPKTLKAAHSRIDELEKQANQADCKHDNLLIVIDKLGRTRTTATCEHCGKIFDRFPLGTPKGIQRKIVNLHKHFLEKGK